MSADLIAYGDCVWEPEITVVNPDGSRETERLTFTPDEGAKIYIDHAVYGEQEGGVGELYAIENYISQERLNELWSEDE